MKNEDAAMTTTPAARPSSPSMKLTAFVNSTTANTVRPTMIGCGSTVTPPIGSWKSVTPLNAMIPAAIIWPPILVSQSSSRMSSMAPRTQTIAAPHSTALSSGPSRKTWPRNGSLLAASIDAAKPRKMATPPSRGIGVECTSRSRTGVNAPVRTATARRRGVAAYVITAATIRTRRYSRTQGASRVGRDSASRVCREAGHEVRHAGPDLLGDRVVGVGVTLDDGLRDEVGDGAHLVGAHPLGGHAGGADADAAGDVGLLGVERDGVLVEDDAGRVGAGLGVGAGDADTLEVVQRQVGVGAAGGGADPLLPQRRREDLGVLDDLLGVGLVLRGGALLEVDRLRRDGVHLRTALHHREDGLVELGGVLLLADQRTRARPAQHLVRREGDDVGVRHRAGDGLAGDEADEVGGVDPEDRPDLVGQPAEELEVDEAWDGRAAREDDLGAVLLGEALHLVVVDVLGLLVDAVVDGVEPLAGEGDLGAVGEVAAHGQRHGEDRVAGLHERAVDRLVGTRAGVRLDVGVVGVEEGLAPLDGEVLGLVDLRAAAVVTAPRVALGVLVGQRRAEGGEHLGAGHVLRGDELQAAADAVEL